jgi:hypothetical protein
MKLVAGRTRGLADVEAVTASVATSEGLRGAVERGWPSWWS